MKNIHAYVFHTEAVYICIDDTSRYWDSYSRVLSVTGVAADIRFCRCTDLPPYPCGIGR